MGVEVFCVGDGLVADEGLSPDGHWISNGLGLIAKEGETYWSGSKPGMLMSCRRKLVGPLYMESVRRSDDVWAGGY